MVLEPREFFLEISKIAVRTFWLRQNVQKVSKSALKSASKCLEMGFKKFQNDLFDICIQ